MLVYQFRLSGEFNPHRGLHPFDILPHPRHAKNRSNKHKKIALYNKHKKSPYTVFLRLSAPQISGIRFSGREMKTDYDIS